MDTEKEVLDLSHYQFDRGDVDFAKVKASGIVGVILKATEGTGFTDSQFKAGAKEAKVQKFPEGVGGYHYAGLTSSADALAEAKWAVSQIKGANLDYFAIDVEEDSKHLSVAALTSAIKVFIDHVKKETGIPVGIYISLNYFSNEVNYKATGADFLWIARYRDKKYGAGVDCHMWQYTQTGSVAGVNGSVDLSVMYKSIIGNSKPVAPSKAPEKTEIHYEDYKVKQGDTFWGIAQAKGVRLSDLTDLNKKVDPSALQVDMVIKIPVAGPTHTPTVKKSTTPALPKSVGGISVIGEIQIANVVHAALIVDAPSSTRSKNLGSVPLGDKLYIHGSVNGWYEVVYRGHLAYVKDDYAKKVR